MKFNNDLLPIKTNLTLIINNQEYSDLPSTGLKRPSIWQAYKPLKNDPLNQKTEFFIDENKAQAALALGIDFPYEILIATDFNQEHTSSYEVSINAGIISSSLYVVLYEALKQKKRLSRYLKGGSLENLVRSALKISKEPVPELYLTLVEIIASEFNPNELPDAQAFPWFAGNKEIAIPFYNALIEAAIQKSISTKQLKRKGEKEKQTIQRMVYLVELLNFAARNYGALNVRIDYITAGLANNGTKDVVPSCLNPFSKINPENSHGKDRDASLQKRFDIRFIEDANGNKIPVYNQPVIVLEGYRKAWQREYVGAIASAFCFEMHEVRDKEEKDAFLIDAIAAHPLLYVGDFDWKKELLKKILEYAIFRGYEEVLLNLNVGISHYSLRDMRDYIIEQASSSNGLVSPINLSHPRLRGYRGKRFIRETKIEGGEYVYLRRMETDPRLKEQFNISDMMFVEGFAREEDGKIVPNSVIASEGNVYCARINAKILYDHLTQN